MQALESLTISLCTLHEDKWGKSYNSSHIILGIMTELKHNFHIQTVFAPKKEWPASVEKESGWTPEPL